MIQLKMNKDIIQYDSIVSADKICFDITDYIEKSNFVLDFIRIDSTIIHNDYEKYIKDNIDNISNIDVSAITKEQLYANIIDSTHQYVLNAIPIIDKMINDFYIGGKENTSIDNLGELIEGINWIVSTSYAINQSMKEQINIFDNHLWLEFYRLVEKIDEVILDLKEAIINMDTTLIADILKYEISETFINIDETLESLMIGKSDDKSDDKSEYN